MNSKSQVTRSHTENFEDDEDRANAGEDTDSDKDMAFLAGILAMMNPPAAQDKKHCMMLKQGTGGIFTLPVDATSPIDQSLHKTTAICTTGCLTCVGVYISIDDKRCFAAHFDGSIYGAQEDRIIHTWQVTDASVASLKKVDRSALDTRFKGMEPALNAFREREDLKEKVIVICPWQVVGGKKTPGFHIINVLCEYFQLDRTKLAANSTHHGFIVDHFGKSPSGASLYGWTRPGLTNTQYDKIAKAAKRGTMPLWYQNSQMIYRSKWEYVFPDFLEWEMLLPEDESADDEKSWTFECVDGGWERGMGTRL